MSFDILIRHGTVVDGTGAAPITADVGIEGDRVTAIGDLSAADAPTTIDATGKIVAPGIIDAHTHSDWCCLLPEEHHEPRLASILQGVTTEVTGNCGISPFPVLGRGDTRMPPGWLFPSLSAYRDAAEERGLVTNVVPLIGHAVVRRSVMGDEARIATPDEIAAMERLVAATMDEGAFGLSTALAMAPGAHAAEQEIVALARVVAGKGGTYTTHMRQESDRVVESVQESIRLGHAAGVPVQISHHKIGGKANWGRSSETLPLIEAARAGGLDLYMDVYPWTATSNGLMDAMPHWLTAGGIAEARERLASRASVDRLAAELGDAPVHASMLVASCPTHPEYEGARIGDIARDLGRSVVETVAHLLLGDPGLIVITFGMDEREVELLGDQPFALAGSDGLPFPGKQHPRVAGTFGLLLGRASRRENGPTLADAIHRMTGLTARRFGLAARGVLAPGNIADIVVFDPATVDTGATYGDPWRRPTGVEHVLLGGAVAVCDGSATGVPLGRVLAGG